MKKGGKIPNRSYDDQISVMDSAVLYVVFLRWPRVFIGTWTHGATNETVVNSGDEKGSNRN